MCGERVNNNKFFLLLCGCIVANLLRTIYHYTISIFNPIYKNDVTLGEETDFDTFTQSDKGEKKKNHALAFVLVFVFVLFLLLLLNSFYSVCDRLLIRRIAM